MTSDGDIVGYLDTTYLTLDALSNLNIAMLPVDASFCQRGCTVQVGRINAQDSGLEPPSMMALRPVPSHEYSTRGNHDLTAQFQTNNVDAYPELCMQLFTTLAD